MSTYTYNGASESDSIDVRDLFEINSNFNYFVVNGNGGDDYLYADERVSSALNGGDGDDGLWTYGYANTAMNGGSGDDQFTIQELRSNSTINVSGGYGNDTLWIGYDWGYSDYYKNGLVLSQAQDPAFRRGQNGTYITLYDTEEGGSAEVYVEDSVEFIAFYDELGTESIYTTKELSEGNTEKYIGTARSDIDWWYASAVPEPTPEPDPTPEPEPYDGIIQSQKGKGVLVGTPYADAFTFETFDFFTKKGAEKIKWFRPSQGDTIAVSPYAFPDLKGATEIKFASTSKKKELKLLSQQDYDFVYFESKGRLYFDGNGSEKNWGDNHEGGLVATLQYGARELSANDFTLLA